MKGRREVINRLRMLRWGGFLIFLPTIFLVISATVIIFSASFPSMGNSLTKEKRFAEESVDVLQCLSLSTRSSSSFEVEEWVDLKEFGGKEGYFLPLIDSSLGSIPLGTFTSPPPVLLTKQERWLKPYSTDLGPSLERFQEKTERIWIKVIVE